MGAGRATSRASQAHLLPPVGAERPQALEARVAPSLVSDHNKSPQEAGTRCRDLPFTHIRAVRNGTDQLAALTCKRWRCPDCGPDLKRRLKKAFVAATEQNPDLRRFVTLTMRGEVHRLPVEEAYRQISATFNNFRRRMATYQGRPFPYALVREPHKSGIPHIHLLTDRYIPSKDLSRIWAQSGSGGYVDIRLVDPQRAAAYLSKYLSKDGNPPPKGMRKYAAGGGVVLDGVRPKGKKGTWHVEVMSTQLDGRPGWSVVDRPGPDIARLALRRWMGDTTGVLRERLAELAQRRELDEMQSRLEAITCIVCGGPHDIHSTAQR